MRVRLLLVVGATFVIALLIGGGLVAFGVPGFGPLFALLLKTAPQAAVAGLSVAFVLAIALVAWMARAVIRPAEQLVASRDDLGTLYESARSRALEDSLTGLANHRAFQRSSRACSPSASATGWTSPCCSSTSTTSRPSTTPPVTPSETICSSRWAASSAGSFEPPTGCSGSAATSSRSSCRTRMRQCEARRKPAPRCLHRATYGRGVPRRGFAFSGGLTAAPAFASSRDQLLNQADEALYQAKRDGRCLVRIFDPGHEQDNARHPGPQRTFGRGRRRAERRRPVARYSNLSSTCETARFSRSRGSRGYPKERRSAIPACSSRQRRRLDGPTSSTLPASRRSSMVRRTIDRRVSLSLNLSPRTLETPEFAPGPFVGRLSLAGWEPQRVIIELTEREAVRDIDRLRSVLERLRATGMRIAADDVGAGNAGLRLLSQIHFDIVKLDLALVQEGARRGSSLDVVRSIADLAARWGAMVIAEGVETPAQLRLLRSLPIAAAQGYLLGRPAAVPDQRSIDLDALESGAHAGSANTVPTGIAEFERLVALRRATRKSA